jgi:hypothetical protein
MSCLLLSCEQMVDVHCSPRTVGIEFAHFDSSEIRKLTVFKFAPNGQFNQPIDTMIVDLVYANGEPTRYSNSYMIGDTVTTIGIDGKYDYFIGATPTAVSWFISGIKYKDAVHHERPSSKSDFNCSMDAYAVNGVQYQGYTIVLK